jgi:hypothetical protein
MFASPARPRDDGAVSMRPLSPATRNTLVICAKAVAFLASLRVLGVALYASNNEQQLPLVQAANDASLYPGDPFVASLQHYASLFWRILWVPFRFIPEVPLLLALTALQRLFVLFAAGRLARAMSDGSRTAELAAWYLFAFGMSPFLGWGTVLPHNFEHTSLAVASFLLCLAFLVEGRLVRAGVCLGLVGVANIIHAFQGILLLVPVVAVLPGLRRQPGIARAALVALAIMAPAIALALQTALQPTIAAGAFLRLLHFYVPAHWFPSSWVAREWIVFGLACGSVLAFCRWRVLSQPARRMVLGLTVGHLLLLLAAVVAEASGQAGLVNLQFARSSDLWTPVAVLFVTAALIKKLEADPRDVRIQMLTAVGLTAALTLWVLRSFLGWFAILSVLFWLAGAWLARSRRPLLAQAAPLVVPVASLMAFLAWNLTITQPDKVRFQPRSQAELELTRWAHQTRVDAGFLVDPNWSAFRMLSRRNSFVTWKEGAGVLWYQPFADEWTRRMRALGVDPLDPRLSYPKSTQAASLAFARLDDQAALRLAQTFGLHYWIVPRNKPSALPTAFQNATAKILVLR